MREDMIILRNLNNAATDLYPSLIYPPLKAKGADCILEEELSEIRRRRVVAVCVSTLSSLGRVRFVPSLVCRERGTSRFLSEFFLARGELRGGLFRT